MQLLLRPFQWIYCIYAIILFIGIMFLLFPFVLLSTLFGRIKGGNMIYRICMLWADIWFFLVGIWHRNIYEQRMNTNQQYIFVANHISYLDGPIIVKAIRRPIRALGKAEMSKVPVFGFIYRAAVVMVDRSSAENRAKSVRNMKSVLKKGISIFVFPEGTFNLTGKPLKDFYDGAFRVALETQTPIKPVLYPDAYDRMNHKSIFSLTPGKNRAVFLEEIPVEGLTISDLPSVKQKTYELMDKKLREYKASWMRS
ncbi:MAG TPA: lysophospholipid acyltransferase family protein [Chitinophagaceae bacterium]